MKVEQTENCILEICCNPTKATSALATRVHLELGVPQHKANDIAEWIKANWDLAPKDSLKAFIENVAANARDYNYE